MMQCGGSHVDVQELPDAVGEDDAAVDAAVDGAFDPRAAAAHGACGGVAIVSLEAGSEGCEFMCQLP